MANKIKLTDQQVVFLSNLPEQGMGYQIVDITLKDGQLIKEKLVFNSTYLQLEDAELINPIDIDRIEIHK